MTNNSGKFISKVSNIETEMTATELSPLIPPSPKLSLLQSVEEYFGRYWWMWIILLLIIKIRTK